MRTLLILFCFCCVRLMGQSHSATFYGAAAIQGAPVSGGAPAGPSYAGPTWVTNGVFTSGAAAVTPALPTGYAANDIFILFVESENGASSELGPPSGWSVVTNLSGVTNGLGALNAADATSLETFWKRATASESAPSVADRGDYALAQIMCIRGAESNAYPFHQVHVMNKPGSSQTVSITNATTTISNCLIVLATTAMFDGSTGDNYSDWYNPSLTNLTERGDVGTITASGGAMANLTGEQWTEGAYLVTTGLVDTTTVSINLTAAIMPVQPRAAMIVTDPVAQSVQTNANATFTVVAGGGTAVPLTYRWQTNSVDVANSEGRWGGSATASLMLTNALLTDSNTLVRCIITNSLGSVTSAVVALSVSELTAIVAHVLLDFEDSTDGTTITPAIFTNFSRGYGSVWERLCYTDPDAFTEGSTTYLKIENDSAKASHSPYLVGGTTYSTAGTRGMRALQTSNQCLGFWEPGNVGYAPLSLGFFWRWNGDPVNDSPRDIVRLLDGGGNYLAFQAYDDASSPYAPYFHAHTSLNNGNNVTIAKNTWYWITMLYASGTGTTKISAYSTADWTLVGESTRAQTSGTTTCKTIQLGSCVYGSGASESFDFDNFLINTNGTYPLGP